VWLLAALACAHVFPCLAEERRAHIAAIEQQVTDISEQLQMTPQQSQQLRVLVSNLNDQLRMLRRTYGRTLSPSDRSDALRRGEALESAFQGQVLSLLSPEQKPQWEQIKAAYRDAAFATLLADTDAPTP
jgi:chromosome segregation ATPase